jgi:trimethylamine--corrinoid protein Co-methyltransferase
VGVKIQHDETITLLLKSGARKKENNIVRIPSFLIEEAISSANKNLVIYNRKKEPAMELGGRRIYFGTGTDLPKTIDLATRKIRDTTSEDIRNSAILGDAMPNIDFIASYGLPKEIPPGLHYIRCFQIEATKSVKPIFFTAESEHDLEVIWEMAAIIAGGESQLREYPFLIHYSEPVSPLTHSREAISKLIFCARKRIPITYTPAILAGSTGPVTMAGTLSIALAEALSGLVIHQLSGKGAPIISGVAATIMDMSKATVSYTAPEFRLMHSAYADIFHSYGLPMWGTAGCSDAQFPDLQAGAEYGLTLLNAALDGTNLIHDCGYMGQGFVASPEMILFANEVIGYVKRYVQGFEMDEAHLAFDLIRKVGPGGHFMGEEHTLNFFRKEQWRPGLFNRDSLFNWEKKGGKRLDETIVEKSMHLLKTHTPEPLPDEMQKELERIYSRTCKTIL